MTNEEYVRRLGILYDKVLELRKDSNYVINQPQMDKLIRLYEFFIGLADESCDQVEPMVLTPKEEHGGITAYFLVFDLAGEKVQEFCKALEACSAMGIETCDGRVCISCTVPNVFVPGKVN